MVTKTSLNKSPFTEFLWKEKLCTTMGTTIGSERVSCDPVTQSSDNFLRQMRNVKKKGKQVSVVFKPGSFRSVVTVL